MHAEPKAVPARYLLHQEGILGLIAVVGVGVQDIDAVAAFAPASTLIVSVTVGLGFGAGCAAILWLLHGLPALRFLEDWQQTLVSEWSISDVFAVALLSGLAEEALLRVLLQPLIGLVPAALVFALLHILPDRRLWFWPVMALVIGLGLGYLFEFQGFPAVATAHIMLNGIGLFRLQRQASENS